MVWAAQNKRACCLKVTNLVVHENCAARLQLVLVNKRHYVDIVLGADRCADNRVVIINDLLQTANNHRRSSVFIHLGSLLLQVQHSN